MDEMSKESEDRLVKMIDRACAGVMSHLQTRIRDAARRAYYMGCQDGMELQRNKEKEESHNAETT